MQGKLETIEAVKAFILGGNAVFTVKSLKTGAHFTFKVSKHKEEAVYFAKLLTGSDNDGDYKNFARIVEHAGTLEYKHNKSSKITNDAPGAKAFAWLWHMIEKSKMPADAEVYHEGKCARCARTLTVPSSIASGFGPECIKHVDGFICEAA